MRGWGTPPGAAEAAEAAERGGQREIRGGRGRLGPGDAPRPRCWVPREPGELAAREEINNRLGRREAEGAEGAGSPPRPSICPTSRAPSALPPPALPCPPRRSGGGGGTNLRGRGHSPGRKPEPAGGEAAGAAGGVS